MAKCGNHGYIIPRNRELLFEMYWTKGMTLPEMGAHFGTTHNSVMHAMNELNIPRRQMGPRRLNLCITCRLAAVDRKPHPLAKDGTGRRCAECQKQHIRELARAYRKPGAMPEEVRERQRRYMQQYNLNGAFTPQGEAGWIRKSKGLLRKNKRLLRSLYQPGASKFPNVESVPEPTSPISCQP